MTSGKELHEHRRHRGFKAAEFAGFRMGEGQYLGVQGKSVDGFLTRTVLCVPHHRVADVLQMNTDLVLSAGLQVELQK